MRKMNARIKSDEEIEKLDICCEGFLLGCLSVADTLGRDIVVDSDRMIVEDTYCTECGASHPQKRGYVIVEAKVSVGKLIPIELIWMED